MQTKTKNTTLAELRARIARIEGGGVNLAAADAIGADAADPGAADPGAADPGGGGAGAVSEEAASGGAASADPASGERAAAQGMAQAWTRPLAFGVAEIDRWLPGRGLQPGRLHEVVGSLDGAGTGFVVHLLRRLMERSGGGNGGSGRIPGAAAGGPVLWCAPQATLYAPGLACRGLDVDRLVCVVASRREDRLWAMEEALRCQGVAAVVGELRARETVDLTASRRLQLAAGQGGALALLLRPPPPRAVGGTMGGGRQPDGRARSSSAGDASADAASSLRSARPGEEDPAAEDAAAEKLARQDAGALEEADYEAGHDPPALGASAAVTRWHVRPLPLGCPGEDVDAGDGPGQDDPGRDDTSRDDDMGRWARWRLTLLRSRTGARHAWTVEVDHATGDLALVAPLRDRSRAAPGHAVA